jgi:hypothetical protein
MAEDMQWVGYQVYKGSQNIPHVPEECFGAIFLGVSAAMVSGMFPGRIFGSELRHRKIDPDYVISVCNEAAMRRDALRGQRPKAMYPGLRPRHTTDSWEHMWWDYLHWRRWKIPRIAKPFAENPHWY